MKRIILGLLAASALAMPAAAQQSAADAVFARARQLVVNGNGAAGRLLIDSVLSATAYVSPVYGEALYWRAALAVSSADAERDYRRLVVEYPVSSHIDEALLQLAQLESARGDRASATQHLDRYLTDYPKGAERPRATLLYVRLLLEQNDLPRGCSALRQTLRDIPDSAVETRNQLEYYVPRCSAADVTRGGAAPLDSVPITRADPQQRDSLRDERPHPAVAPRARFTLQVAAYKSKADADALARRLKARKLDARVVAGGKLYRVRVGRYTTRGAAVAAQKELKAKKIDAFVTEIGADDK